MTTISQFIILFFLNNFTYPLATYLFVSSLIGALFAFKVITFLREIS